MSSDEARAFAQEWVEIFPCDFAEGFKTVTKELKNFAYATDGLNMSSSGAEAYSRELSLRLCSRQAAFKKEFKEWYKYAYSTTGLNYSSTEATAYAKQKIEQRHLSCSGLRE